MSFIDKLKNKFNKSGQEDQSEKTMMTDLNDLLKQESQLEKKSDAREHKSIILKLLQKFLPGIYNKIPFKDNEQNPQVSSEDATGQFKLESELADGDLEGRQVKQKPTKVKKKFELKIYHIIVMSVIAILLFSEELGLEKPKLKEKPKVTKQKKKKTLKKKEEVSLKDEDKEPQINVDLPVTKKVELAEEDDAPLEQVDSEPDLNDLFPEETVLEDNSDIESNSEDVEIDSEDIEIDIVADDNNLDIDTLTPTEQMNKDESDRRKKTSDEIVSADLVDDPEDTSSVDDFGFDIVDEKKSQGFSDDILSKLEKEAKGVKQSQLSTQLRVEQDYELNYELAGSSLVYNCKGGHWACVDSNVFSKCAQSKKNSSLNSLELSCFPVEVYSNNLDCERVQTQKVTKSDIPGACNI